MLIGACNPTLLPNHDPQDPLVGPTGYWCAMAPPRGQCWNKATNKGSGCTVSLCDAYSDRNLFDCCAQFTRICELRGASVSIAVLVAC